MNKSFLIVLGLEKKVLELRIQIRAGTVPVQPRPDTEVSPAGQDRIVTSSS
jgi:hypothetical protein